MALRLIHRLEPLSNIFHNSTSRRSLLSVSQIQDDNINEKKLPYESHVYGKRLGKDDLIKFLVDNVVYNNDGIIITNKPYGLASTLTEKNRVSNFKPQTFTLSSFQEILPELARKLCVDSVQVVKAPERYATGVTILATTEKAAEIVTKSVEYTNNYTDCPYTYLVVTVGKPVHETLETVFAMKLKSDKEPELCEKWTKSDVKHGRIKAVRWKHVVLTSSKHSSLVKVEISRTRNNCLRNFLAVKCLSPVLGDRLNGPKVHSLMGVPLLSSADSSSSQFPQELSSEILEALQLNKAEEVIPNMVHLESLTLRLNKSSKFHFSVPPSELFTYTCKQLNLNLDVMVSRRKNCSPQHD